MEAPNAERLSMPLLVFGADDRKDADLGGGR